MVDKILLTICGSGLLLPFFGVAQIKPSTPKEILQTRQKIEAMSKASIFKEYPVRSIGPVVQGARITDLAVHPENPKIFYVAYASGGIYKTTDNGITLVPVFDQTFEQGIGDIAISPTNPDIIWVGSGENNSSRSSYAGSGIYKSEDGGKSWSHSGLTGTQHTGRIITHPSNPDIVWVAAMGNLYTSNKERGVYKTVDRGRTWEKTLFIDEHTGVIDMIINPQNPDQLWVSSWERTRKAWNFDGDGKGSAIYTSNDGGETWTYAIKGFPAGEKVGRIGIAVSPSHPHILYALLDNQEEMPDSEADSIPPDSLVFKSYVDMDKKAFLAIDDARLDTFLRHNGFPEKYEAKQVKSDVRDNKYPVSALANYFGDANEALFKTRIKGAEVYRSDNAGETWAKVNEYELKGVYHTYGYYFGEIRVAPDNPDKIYITGVPLLFSEDGGKTYTQLDTFRVHGDHHALWIDPRDSEHLILGNDGGLYVSYDEGKHWLKLNTTATGQFYTVAVDMAVPYNVYGGLQDNGVMKGSSRSVPNRRSPWKRIWGGDGMYIAVDPRDDKTVYTGYQFGNYFKLGQGKPKMITPRHELGEDPLRFNWRSPLIMSPHNPDILYLGAQRVYRTVDGGESWDPISPDLTTNYKPAGNVPYSTLTALSESSFAFGMIWAGTDDGQVYLTKNGGADWIKVTGKLPPQRWVSSIQASPHDEQTAFVALNGYRNDEFKTYIYKTEDFGHSWTDLKGNLPEDVVNILLQDPVNPNLLYVGMDHGTFISLDGGKSWHLLNGVPAAASYDMVVHPRDNELVVATHGRSMYAMDVKPLQELRESFKDIALKVYQPKKIRYHKKWGEQPYPYLEAKTPRSGLLYYTGKKQEGPVKIQIRDASGQLLAALEGPATEGFHRVFWDLRQQPAEQLPDDNGKNEAPFVKPGTYEITFTLGDTEQSTRLIVK